MLFATEMVMNYAVLVIYCKISRKRFRRFRCFLAVLFSSIFGVCGIMAAMIRGWKSSGYSLIVSVLAALLEIAVLQERKRPFRQNFLELPALLLSAALLAGGLLYGKSAIHMKDLFLKTLITVLLLTAGVTVIYWRQRGIQENNLKRVRITFGGETYTVTAITDTGNNLYDKLSGLPIHIVEQKCILEEKQKEQLFENEPERITFVPYSSLGNPHGLLMVLQVEQLMILDNRKKIELRNQKLGLTDQKLDGNGRWQMLLHPDLEACIHEKGGCV